MPYVICEPCIGVKDCACADVCPVDCIHPAKSEPGYDAVEQLYIHPDECIDCGACVDPCPVDAIFAEEDVPDRWQQYTAKNADYYSMSGADFQAKWGSPGQPG